MKKLLELFEEPNGGMSSTRVIFVLWFLSRIFCTTYLTLKNGAMPALDPSLLGLDCALLGGKWAQRREEAKNETTVN